MLSTLWQGVARVALNAQQGMMGTFELYFLLITLTAFGNRLERNNKLSMTIEIKKKLDRVENSKWKCHENTYSTTLKRTSSVDVPHVNWDNSFTKTGIPPQIRPRFPNRRRQACSCLIHFSNPSTKKSTTNHVWLAIMIEIKKEKRRWIHESDSSPDFFFLLWKGPSLLCGLDMVFNLERI